MKCITVYSFLGTSIIGMINLVMAYIFVTCLNHAAGLFFLKKKNCFVWFPKIHYFVVVECQVHKIRGLFFKAILRQDIGWYDTHQTGDFAAKMAEWANLALLLFLKNFYMLSTCSESFFFEIAEIWTNSRKVLERKSECLFSLSLFSPPVWSMPSITDGNSLWLF